LWGLKRCTKPTHVPSRPGPAQTMDIIYVDTSSGEAVEKSSSYNLPIFSFGAYSEGAEVVTVTREDSSPSVKELWLDIDKLDDPPCEDTSVVRAHNASICGKRSAAPFEDANKLSMREGKRDSLPDVAGTSDFRSKGREDRSMRKEAARILSATPDAISPRMRRSFVDRRYSPSTDMGLSEWEIILDELIHM
jgi:hypothetical protein